MQQVGSVVHQGITTEGKARLQETPTEDPVLIETEAEVPPKAEVHPERIVAGSNKAELEVHQEKIAEEQQQVEAGALQGTTEVARLLQRSELLLRVVLRRQTAEHIQCDSFIPPSAETPSSHI